jgi:hypothetical protein
MLETIIQLCFGYSFIKFMWHLLQGYSIKSIWYAMNETGILAYTPKKEKK